MHTVVHFVKNELNIETDSVAAGTVSQTERFIVIICMKNARRLETTLGGCTADLLSIFY